MRAPLLLLSLALVGCVTVQPCVCPLPAPKPTLPYTPEFVPDVLIPKEVAEPIDFETFETSCTITEPSGKTYPCDQAPKLEVLIRTKEGCFLRIGSWSGWGVCPEEKP